MLEVSKGSVPHARKLHLTYVFERRCNEHNKRRRKRMNVRDKSELAREMAPRWVLGSDAPPYTNAGMYVASARV